MGRGREETIDTVLIKRNLHLVQRLSRLTGKQSTLTGAFGFYSCAYKKGEKLLQDKQWCRI